jgi:hypothetical protein
VNTVDDLALEVAQVNGVIVHNAQSPDAGRSQVQKRRRSQATGTYDKDFRILKPALAHRADFGNDEMPGVPFHLGRRQSVGRFNEWRQDRGRSGGSKN